MCNNPPCPNCGSSLVLKQRTGGIFFGHTLKKYDFHRCYRCFHLFSQSDENDE